MASPFSGRAGRLAAMAVTDYLNRQQGSINSAIKSGQKNSIDSLNTGYNNAYGSYDKAYDLYNPYAQTGLKAFNQYADATGVNGQSGYDRVVNSFRASPGYQNQVNEATDAVARQMSSLGALGSGNTMTAITEKASNLADQEYGKYLDRLNGMGQMGYAATGAQAGILQGKGGLQAQQGRDKSNVYQGYTGMRVNSMQNTGGQVANAIQGGMMAGQNAAANRMGALMSGLQLGSSVLGGLFGGGGFSGLSGIFGGGGGLTGGNYNLNNNSGFVPAGMMMNYTGR